MVELSQLMKLLCGPSSIKSSISSSSVLLQSQLSYLTNQALSDNGRVCVHTHTIFTCFVCVCGCLLHVNVSENETDLWQVWEQLEACVISPPPVSLRPVLICPGSPPPPHALCACTLVLHVMILQICAFVSYPGAGWSWTPGWPQLWPQQNIVVKPLFCLCTCKHNIVFAVVTSQLSRSGCPNVE